MENWTVYLLECADHSYYCGVCKTARLTERIQEHNQGHGARYTRSRTPVRLLVFTRALTKSYAYQVEYKTKKMARKRKIEYLQNI
jgi:putative endonuclease